MFLDRSNKKPIHVSDGGDFGETIYPVTLHPEEKDWEYDPGYPIYNQGDGSKDNPYEYRVEGVPQLSEHGKLIALYQKYGHGYIKAGRWRMKIADGGLIAKDGTFTRLDP